MIHAKLESNLITVISLLLGLGLIIPSTLLLVRADSINPGVYGIDSKPYGIPYAVWAGKWEQWLISVPQPFNPATDPTGKNCAQNQVGPVWFLAGTTGGSAERTCAIPAGKAVLFPVMGSECDYEERISFPLLPLKTLPILSTTPHDASFPLRHPPRGICHIMKP